MKKTHLNFFINLDSISKTFLVLLVFLCAIVVNSQVTLETEIKITDSVMYFDGKKVSIKSTANSTTGYDYVYGPALSPHGDCLKAYEDFVFMTWYRGGKEDRHVMLSRYNKVTGVLKTIEFPHQHTGYNNQWWIGETHNTIAVGICPKDETIHMVYDMHRNGNVPSFENDYLRYSYSVASAATVPDEEFTIDLFVQSPNNNYKHLEFPGINDERTTKLLTYPAFMTNDEGDLFMKNRFGYDKNGKFLFAKYDGNDWEGYTDFNRTNATSHGSPYTWGLYGDIKYVNGKIRIGFQQRANIRDDKYWAQNGIYYAYSDDPNGLTQWKNHEGTSFTRPLAVSDLIKVSEPGDLVKTTKVDKVRITSGFDWTVTDSEDIHFIARVKDEENNVTKHVHTYKPSGAKDFITSTDFSRSEAIYAAGDDVYLIGLNAGRPIVQRAEGGTNLFTKIYEQTSGKRFSKGQVYIHEGKLHYYLLENNPQNADDTRTVYLQIIDLDISTGPKPFAVNLNRPTEGQSFEEDETIQLFANATADTGEITKVEFWINDALVNEATAKPYLFDWKAGAIGDYTIKAVAYKTGGESISSSEVTIAVTAIDKSDLTGDVYKLKNVATGKYLTSNDTALMASDARSDKAQEWEFIHSGAEENYYNIDSKTSKGILRFVASSADGEMINTGFSPPRTDGDKIWDVLYNEADNTYTFEARDIERYLRHNEADAIVHSEIKDDRSKWKAESTTRTQTLSTIRQELKTANIRVYPNPTRGEFTIALTNLKASKIQIYALDGKLVYSNETTQQNVTIKQGSLFTSGMYIVQVKGDGDKVHRQKLIIK